MFKQRKSADKAKMIDTIRRFIKGEDVIAEVLPLSYGVAVLNTDELNKMRILHAYKEKHGIDLIEPGWTFEMDGKSVNYDDYIVIEEKMKHAVVMLPANNRDRPSWASDEQILLNEVRPQENGPLVWHEQKTYPEIEGVSYSRPENVPVIESKPIVAPIPEKKKSTERSERKENKPIIEPQATNKEVSTFSAHTERGNRMAWINGRQIDIDEMGWNDVPFSSWINSLGRR